MLFDHWQQIARDYRDEIALQDFPSGQSWTFEQMASAAEKGRADREPIAFAHSDTTEFVFAVLRAWRAQQIFCPLEPGEPIPAISGKLPGEIVHLKITSATTGDRRLVAFTAGQLIADAENIVTTMGLRPDWRNLGVISLAHSYGFSNLVLPLLLHGIPLRLAGSSLPEAVLRAGKGADAITLPAVPALWRAWHDAEAIPEQPLRLAISAGAPLPLTLEQSIFESRGLKVHNFYGSTECGGIAYDSTSSPRMDALCAGALLRNVQASVADDGCLEVRGPAVGQTYWPEATRNLRAGVFHTSDLAEIISGSIYLRGRATDQINVAGRKVSPEAIEKVLATHPLVRECLVFGVPNANAGRGEMIVGCLSVKGEVTSEDLRQFLIATLPAWQVPREWWFVESLEINQRGKLPRAEWRKRFLERAV